MRYLMTLRDMKFKVKMYKKNYIYVKSKKLWKCKIINEIY